MSINDGFTRWFEALISSRWHRIKHHHYRLQQNPSKIPNEQFVIAQILWGWTADTRPLSIYRGGRACYTIDQQFSKCKLMTKITSHWLSISLNHKTPDSSSSRSSNDKWGSMQSIFCTRNSHKLGFLMNTIRLYMVQQKHKQPSASTCFHSERTHRPYIEVIDFTWHSRKELPFFLIHNFSLLAFLLRYSLFLERITAPKLWKMDLFK